MDDIRPDSSQTLKLLDQAAQGNPQALGDLIDRHLPLVKAAVAGRIDRRVQARLDASDIVQETNIEVTQRIRDYLAARPMPFHLWIKRATHQQLLKAERRHLQTAKRAVDREVPLPDRTSIHLAARVTASGTSPVSQAARKELARKVRQTLAQLADVDREIIMLRNFDALSNGEAACILDISPDAAKKRYARALQRLLELLRGKGLTGASV